MIIQNQPQPVFADLAERRGYKIEEPSQEMVKAGIDIILWGVYKDKKKEARIIFSVKRRKTKKISKYLDRWTWIEYKGSGGKDGWIYGPSHFIAFERSKDFVIISRKVLLEFINSNKCKVRWDLPFAKTPKEAKYRIFRHPSSGAQISQILTKDIMKLEGAQVWRKDVGAS
ncbi:MAG: hypothetical protein CL885_03130 [Dehalococcoidia bacterium]|nr:hypothetical protein [Dehalococcoidia bacterium]